MPNSMYANDIAIPYRGQKYEDEDVAFYKGQEAFKKGDNVNPYKDEQFPNPNVISAWENGYNTAKMNKEIKEAMEFTSHYAGLTQYSGEKFTLAGGIRVPGGLNVGEKSYYRLKYQIYSNELFTQTTDEELANIGTVEIGRNNDGTIACLIDIKLKPKFRKSGYGRALIQEIVDTTIDGLYVIDVKKSAIKFWEKVGIIWDDNVRQTKNGWIKKSIV